MTKDKDKARQGKAREVTARREKTTPDHLPCLALPCPTKAKTKAKARQGK